MIVLGLTGSIGMGKTNAARALARLGVPVFAADDEVHRLTAPHGPAIAAIAAAFPTTVARGRLDRSALARIVFADRAALKRLEAILHPRVYAAERRFLAQARRGRRALVALDIPLLFEAGRARLVDAVLVVSAPRAVQTARVLARPGMTPEKLAAVRDRQMSDVEKRRRADYIVPTGLSRRDTLRRLARIVEALRRRPPHRRRTA